MNVLRQRARATAPVLCGVHRIAQLIRIAVIADRQRVLTAVVTKRDGKYVLNLSLPHGLNLPRGVDIWIDEANASLKVQTASGDVEVKSVREGDVVLQTASGDIEVGIKQGSKLWIDAKSMSGETSSELEIGDAPTDGEGPTVEVRATAMSGDIRVKRTYGDVRRTWD